MQALTLHSHIQTLDTQHDKYALISIDFSKAFDKVNRNTLYKILKINKWDDTYISLIKTLLENRKTHLKQKNKLTKPINKKRSIEQGNGLSGLLFDIFVDKMILNQIKTLNTPNHNTQNRLQNININENDHTITIQDPKSLVIAFADDNNMVIPINKIPIIIKTIEKVAQLLQLEINTIKSTIIPLKHNNHIPQIILQNKILPQKAHTKILGFQFSLHGIDTNLMTNIIKEKVNQGINLASRLKITNHLDNSLHPKAKLNIFKQHIQPLYEYFLTPTIIASSDYTNNDKIKELLKYIYDKTNTIMDNIICSKPNNPLLSYSLLGLSNIYQRRVELEIRLLHQIFKSAFDNPIQDYIPKINPIINHNTHTINTNAHRNILQKHSSLFHFIQSNIHHLLIINPTLTYYWFPIIKHNNQNWNQTMQICPQKYTQIDPENRKTNLKFNLPNKTNKWPCCPPGQNENCPIHKQPIPNLNGWNIQVINPQNYQNTISIHNKGLNELETRTYFNQTKNTAHKSTLIYAMSTNRIL